MPPNVNDSAKAGFVNDNEAKSATPTVAASSSSHWSAAKVMRSLITVIACAIIWVITGSVLAFAFRNQLSDATKQHIILCVIGFQCLMAHGILGLALNSFLFALSLKQKRWVHWSLQITGSVLALTGCFIKIVDKSGEHWNTPHGQFGLSTMVFTTISLVNGFASLYSHELRRFLPGAVSRLTHILCGIAAVTCASVALSFGFDKGSFRNWAQEPITNALIALNSIATLYLIFNPCYTFTTKLFALLRW